MSDAAQTTLQGLLHWIRATPAYTYTVDATEYSGSRAEASRFEITVDERVPSEVVRVVGGQGSGSVLTWTGGERVRVRPPGVLHALRLRLSVRDPKVLSLRGNDIRIGILSRVAACFSAHADHLSVENTRWAGQPAVALTISHPSGIRCGAEDGDSTITRDRLVLAERDDRPLERERSIGSTVVVRWIISDARAAAAK
ncbi:MAG: hypothetical protein ABR591_08470 [Candidatus Velthaea sp.]